MLTLSILLRRQFYEHRYNVDDKNRKITARIKENSYDFYELIPPGAVPSTSWYELPNEDIKWEIIYNEQGFMSNYKVWNDDRELVLEIALQALTIPGYDIPILLGVMGVSVVGVIYVIMRKRK